MNLTAWCAGSIFAVLALHACASERAETGRLCSAQVELAEELMSEQNWEAALCESRRALILGPTNQAARLIGLLSQVRLGRKPSGVLQELEAIAANADSPRLGAMAAYEAARLLVESGDWTRAYEWLKLVFLRADDRDLFMKSGCTLSLLLKEHPELEPGNADIRTRILTSEHLWNSHLREECALSHHEKRNGLFALPGAAIVAFYRSFISPAIGARCSLEPSCSKFFLEASRRHGLLAFPILADRLVREPSVVGEARRRVIVEEKRRIADPLDDHDAWLSETRQVGGATQ